MSECRYCTADVVWVPTVEGARPFNAPPVLSPDAPVVVMKAHDCESRKQFLAGAAERFMQNLSYDPEIRASAMTLACPNERCGAPPEYDCKDLRTGHDRATKNPHKERLIAGAHVLQEGTGDA